MTVHANPVKQNLSGVNTKIIDGVVKWRINFDKAEKNYRRENWGLDDLGRYGSC
jgi:hypothetical protein